MGEAFITRRGGKSAKKLEIIGVVYHSGSLSLPFPVEDYDSFRIVISGSVTFPSSTLYGAFTTFVRFGDQEVVTYSITPPGGSTAINQTTNVVIGSTPDGTYVISTVDRTGLSNSSTYQKLLDSGTAASKTIYVRSEVAEGGSASITQTVYGYR